jgi:ADP-ribose pyrophosphatase YjhB (NUDIX family)
MSKKFLYDLWRDLPVPDFIRYLFIWLIFPKFLIGVDGLIMNDQEECLLFKHSYRKKTPWGFPGGYLKKGESPEEAIIREIFEESGYRVEIIDILHVDTSKVMQRMDMVYIGRWVGGEEFKSSDEVVEAKFFPMEDLPDLIPEQVEIIRKYRQWVVEHRR